MGMTVIEPCVEENNMSNLKNPLHPGEVLKGLYLQTLEITTSALARRLAVPRIRIERLVKLETGITSDLALRLSKAFATTPAYWMNMQVKYDMIKALKR
jgi:addiction module HigA family antidote